MIVSFKSTLVLATALTAANISLAGARIIEEVIVTSQKTSQNLQDVPISVSAITGDALRDANISTLSELAVQLPNVNFASEGQRNEQVYIRGFGTNPFNPSFESSVGLVQDEVFYGRAPYFSELPFDVERIEVLRGPQGTLFGKNTVAGVFSLTSRGISEEPQLYMEAGISEHGGTKFEIGAGGMVSDRVGVRVSALNARHDGQIYNYFIDRDEQAFEYSAARLKMLFLLSDNAELELTALTGATDSNFWPNQLYILQDDTREYLQDFDPNIEGDGFDYSMSANTPGTADKDTNTFAAKLSIDLTEAVGAEQLDMTVVLASTDMQVTTLADLDGSPADIATMFIDDDYQQYTLEWRFSGRTAAPFGLGEGVDFVTGIYLFKSDYVFHGGFKQGEDTTDFILSGDAAQLAGDLALALPALYALTLTQRDQRYDLNFDRTSESASLFGQFTWHLTDTFSVTPGLRMNRETKQADVAGTLSCESVVPVVGGLAPCTFGLVLGANTYDLSDQERSVDDFSPKLSLMYAPNDEINFYSTMSVGFKSGGYNALSFSGEQLTYDDETARTIEFGSKGRFFDRSLSLNVAVFYTEFEDLQVLAFNGVFFDVRNAATAASKGLELDWQWLSPWEAFSLSGALGLLDSYYTSYPGAPSPVTDGQGAEQDLAGREVAYSPESSLTVSPKLEIPLGDNLGIQTVLDIVHNGDKYTDTDLDENTKVPANTKLNLRISLGHISRSWAVTVGMKNLTDERTLNAVTDAPFFPGTYFTQQAPGREYFASLRLDI
ncbi:TonB-dependent receptor [Zhongshania arctica]|uniref:TonB-dependent receptor n=1 Tax=Zhongshania arctica TaxID=3238302 RepID=A0ABV3U043_9GAMM